MIVGLTLWPPPLISLSQSVLPKCCPPLPQLFLKQRQQASGTKELLTKCKVIPQPDRCRQRMRLEASSWWSVQLSPGNVLSFICLAPCCSLSDEFHPMAQVYEDPSVLTRARLRAWLPSHQHSVMFGVRTAREWGEGTQNGPSAIKHYAQNRRIWLNHEFTFTVMDTGARSAWAGWHNNLGVKNVVVMLILCGKVTRVYCNYDNSRLDR